MRYYPALIETAADGSYGVVFPDFPGCASAGDTADVAVAHAAEALALHVEGLREDGLPVPEPSALDAPLPDWLDDVVGVRVLVGVEPPGRAVRVNVTLDEALLGRIDRMAAATRLSRSGFLAEAARRLLRERAEDS
jgi:predicted RNase H-like HicB family nuclease